MNPLQVFLCNSQEKTFAKINDSVEMFALLRLSAGNYSICHLHEENNTLHEYLTINSFKEVTDFMKEIIYEEQ